MNVLALGWQTLRTTFSLEMFDSDRLIEEEEKEGEEEKKFSLSICLHFQRSEKLQKSRKRKIFASIMNEEKGGNGESRIENGSPVRWK